MAREYIALGLSARARSDCNGDERRGDRPDQQRFK
jgi:hypothetical protein